MSGDLHPDGGAGEWLAAADGSQSTGAGYRVQAVRVGPGWRYAAWAPLAMPALNYWQWLAQAEMRLSYARGENIPQRRPLLGVFASATLARACCEHHAHPDETATHA